MLIYNKENICLIYLLNVYTIEKILNDVIKNKFFII